MDSGKHEQDDKDDVSSSWRERVLGDEHDRWMRVKRLLNLSDDSAVVKILLDFFQKHGGFDLSWKSRLRSESQARTGSPTTPGYTDDIPNGSEDAVSESDDVEMEHDQLLQAMPSDSSTLEEVQEQGMHLFSDPENDHHRSVEIPVLVRTSPSPESTLGQSCPAPVSPLAVGSSIEPGVGLPAVEPQLLPYFSCGLCGAAGHTSLLAHLDHLWHAHTELQMLGSKRQSRLPLKLRPHMFVLCALCGLNNRCTNTAGVADGHLTRAHFPARHKRLMDAVRDAPELEFACDECDVAVTSRAELAVHVLDSGHACAPSMCDECGTAVDGETNAWRHELRHRVQRPFQCYLCAERFPTEPDCVSHVHAEHERHYNVHMCSRCPYSVSLVAQFIKHVRSHVGLNTVVCHQCGVTFHTTASLRRHLQTHTRTEFPCEHCDKKFRHPLSLERHVRSRHISPAEHTCNHCGKMFPSRYHLERHVMIHSNERRHQCDRCGRAFIQKGDLLRHRERCRRLEFEIPGPRREESLLKSATAPQTVVAQKVVVIAVDASV